MKLKLATFIACLVFLLAEASFAEIVVLKNGNRYQTDQVIPMAGAYYFKAGGKMMNVSIADVETIEHEAKAAPAKAEAVTTETVQQPAPPVEESELAFITQCRTKMEADAAKRKSDYEQTCARALGMVEGLYTGSPPSVEMFDYYFNIIEGKSFWIYLTPDDGEKLKAILYRDDGPLDKEYIALAEARKDLAYRTAQAREALAKAGAAPNQTQNTYPYNPYLTNPYSMYPYGYAPQFGYPFTAYADAFGNAYLGTGYSTFYPGYSTFYPSYFGDNYRGNYSGRNYNNDSNRNYRNYSLGRDVHVRGYTRGSGTRVRSHIRSRSSR